MKKVFIAPSILSADFSTLGEEIKSLDKYGASYLHFDVMDGHFVPNISFGPYVLKCIKKLTPLIIDVHLMITNPLKYYEEFIKAGADIITIHYEALNEEEIFNLINLIHSKNIKVGLAISPKTHVDVLTRFLDKVDLVLVMSVEPGFGGQSFIPESLNKIKELDTLRAKNNYKYLIEVDGGINEKTYKDVILNGADILVAGSYIFKAKDRKKAIESISSI